jgi:hypothetical protein
VLLGRLAVTLKRNGKSAERPLMVYWEWLPLCSEGKIRSSQKRSYFGDTTARV